LRLIHYPPAHNGDSGDFELGCGEHTDFGIFTMILCDEVPDTLQIRPKGETEWVTVDPVPGGFICNIGDMLSRWTNGIYVSTPHRVLRPRDSSRISVPYFYEPNYDALVSPMDELVTKSGRPPCLEAIRYGDYLLAKTSTNFAY
jgi:isopenicillin N synthase-like dioxygenase